MKLKDYDLSVGQLRAWLCNSNWRLLVFYEINRERLQCMRS